MFDLNRRYNRPIVAPTVLPIVAPIQIKHVHSCVSYQHVTYQKYDRRGHESLCRYRALGPIFLIRTIGHQIPRLVT